VRNEVDKYENEKNCLEIEIKKNNKRKAKLLQDSENQIRVLEEKY